MMTFKEFMVAHPNLMHADRVNLAGFDFQALHERIEKSRYLKTRRSLVYFQREYAAIINGKFDDFKLEVPKDEPKPNYDEATLKKIELVSSRLLKLKRLKVTDSVVWVCKHYVDCTPSELMELMEKATGCVGYIPDALMKYNSFVGGLYSELKIKV